MSTTAEQHPTHSATLDIPLRQTIHGYPYWHRDEPVVAVSRMDPEYAELRRNFPDSWRYLVRVKKLFDSVSALDAPSLSGDDPQYAERIDALLTTAADTLLRFAEAERGPATRAVVEHARTAAQRLADHVVTREWKPVTLYEPRPGEPWLYCGPISTWATRDVASPVALLVAVPDAGLQAEVDEVSSRVDAARAEAARVLGGPVRSVQQLHPTMQITDLLLAGGESVSGHKNFAHFFPLEAAGSTVLGPEFTVVFANVHRERLRRCSLELLRGVADAPDEARLDEALRMSLRWFRCHDLGHFWRRTSIPGDGRPAQGLEHFERMALEEAYADTLGLLTADALGGAGEALDTAFAAELIRYLSRRHHHFADSAAAMLTLGWIQQHAEAADFPVKRRFLQKSRPTLEDLVRTLHDVLWDADGAQLVRLRSALAKGAAYYDTLAEHLGSTPTDLSYTFG
ncbi:hypothetical protein [Streptomyces sp. JJ38]|uniref:hypothetical protein n=1 Tax=Streptomyces sp. JJ38 TaxID=2738128 RepID=UPI001C57811C|nr:hypothetical protein [Streptomyces sp. JJ38]MBW1595845.1 hypothetical protein [Streptomyces sp. JJ38]